MKKQKEQIWVMVFRILLAAVFLFSGFSKAIDPVASAIQFEDYFTSFGLGFLHPISLFCGVAMNIVEMTLGFMLLFRIRMRFTGVVYLLFMSFFFLLTMWLFVAEYLEINYGYNFGVVKDCGCFGKAVEMSNLETFIKNIFLMIPTIIIFMKRKEIPDIRLTVLGQWLFTGIFVVLVGLLQLYCYQHLPIIDFGDWKKGKNIKEIFIGEPAEKEMLFVYQSKKDSSIVHLNGDEIMTITDENPSFYEDYDYVDRVDTTIKKAIPPKIDGFCMVDSLGKDYSHELITNSESEYLFILFMNNLGETKMKGIEDVNLHDVIVKCKESGIPFVGITNSSQEEINKFTDNVNTLFPIYHQTIDPIKGPFMVRDAIRSNPGLILLKDGIVTDKWAWRDFPEFDQIKF